MTRLVRGQVLRVRFGSLPEPRLFVVVSNNARNRSFDEVLAVRLTTTPKQSRPSVVDLRTERHITGFAVCDDIEVVYEDEVIGVVGAFSPPTMRAVDRGLAAALALD